MQASFLLLNHCRRPRSDVLGVPLDFGILCSLQGHARGVDLTEVQKQYMRGAFVYIGVMLFWFFGSLGFTPTARVDRPFGADNTKHES